MGSASLSPAHLNITSCCNTVESRTSGIDLSCTIAKMTFVAILLLVACIAFHDASAQNMGNMWNMGMGRWNNRMMGNMMGNNYNNYGMRNMGLSNWNGGMMGNMRGNNYGTGSNGYMNRMNSNWNNPRYWPGMSNMNMDGNMMGWNYNNPMMGMNRNMNQRNGHWNSNNFGMGNMNGMNNMMNMNMDRKHPQTTYNDADFAVRATVMDKDEINYQYRINLMEIYKQSEEMNWEEGQTVTVRYEPGMDLDQMEYIILGEWQSDGAKLTYDQDEYGYMRMSEVSQIMMQGYTGGYHNDCSVEKCSDYTSWCEEQYGICEHDYSTGEHDECRWRNVEELRICGN